MHEFWGYLAIVFNLAGRANRRLVPSLWLEAVSLFLYTLNLYLLATPLSGILTNALCLTVNLLSLLLIYLGKEHLKPLFIKLSLIPAAGILFAIGLNPVGYASAAGFFLSSVAKLQKDVLAMKLWFIVAILSWIVFDFLVRCESCKLFDILGIGFLFYAIYKIVRERKKTAEQPRL